MNRMTVAHQVATTLREEIFRAELPPGVHLRQEQVADRLGVSTTPVREAFRILEAEGLVRLDPGKGVLVFRPSIDEVRETYEIRESLEMLAVRHTVKHVSDENLEELDDILKQLDEESDREAWIRLNNHFHDRMYAFGARPKLSSMIVALRDSMAGYMHSAIQRAVESGRASDEHQEIVDACRARDVERAQEAVRIHLHHTVNLALSFMEDAEAQPS